MQEHLVTLWNYSPVKKPQYRGLFCDNPWETLEIDQDGDALLCGCQRWMPFPIGNIYKNTIQEIWLGELAQQVRQSVADGDFTYCSSTCPRLSRLVPRPAELPPMLEFPGTIKFDLDSSCNLKCPSCRESVRIEKNADNIKKQTELFNEMREYALANPTVKTGILPIGNGELFASHSGLAFLESLKDYPHNNLRLMIYSNGTLVNRNRELINRLRHVIYSWSISVDAVNQESYSKIRGGDWNELLLGLEFLKNWRGLNFNFCIQRNNYHDIEAFADFASGYGATVTYQKLDDWGHWWGSDFWKDNAVAVPGNEEFNKVLESLRRVQTKYPNQISMVGELIKFLKNTP